MLPLAKFPSLPAKAAHKSFMNGAIVKEDLRLKDICRYWKMLYVYDVRNS